MNKVFFALTFLFFAVAGRLHAADSGEDVVVVYNSRLPESKGVADHYAERRQVPASHLIGLPLSTNEEVSRIEFQDSLQKPLAKALEGKKLWHMGSHVVPATMNQAAHVEWKVLQSKIR